MQENKNSVSDAKAEHRHLRALPQRSHLYRKLAASVSVGILIIIFSLLIGVFGYHFFFHLGYVDSLYNASMILTGMGPVNAAPSNAAKIFASAYAIYSGVAFLTSAAVIFSPIIHRFLHKFRLDVEG